MTSFKVNQKSKVVTAYRQSMSTEDYKIIERYNNMGYDVIMLEKTAPKKKAGIKREELIKYLKDNIDNSIYNEMLDRLDKKQNFLRIKSWLVTALQEYAEKNNKEYETIKDIIERAKENENLKEAREQENKQSESKSKVVDMQKETSKAK